MPAILWRRSCQSRKKINSSGGLREIKFAADRFFNLFPLASVVLGEFVSGFTGLETFSDDIRDHARASNYGFDKRYVGNNDIILWLISCIHEDEGIKPQR